MCAYAENCIAYTDDCECIHAVTRKYKRNWMAALTRCSTNIRSVQPRAGDPSTNICAGGTNLSNMMYFEWANACLCRYSQKMILTLIGGLDTDKLSNFTTQVFPQRMIIDPMSQYFSILAVK